MRPCGLRHARTYRKQRPRAYASLAKECCKASILVLDAAAVRSSADSSRHRSVGSLSTYSFYNSDFRYRQNLSRLRSDLFDSYGLIHLLQ